MNPAADQWSDDAQCPCRLQTKAVMGSPQGTYRPLGYLHDECGVGPAAWGTACSGRAAARS